MKVRKHFYFSGWVQGVGFRFKATYLARKYGLTGWVRNLSDGRVEMRKHRHVQGCRKVGPVSWEAKMALTRRSMA